MNLIAMGGGGFTAETDPLLDDLVLTLAKGPSTRCGLILTASDHDPVRIERYQRLLAPRVQSARLLPPAADAAALSEFLAGLDLLYIGGGDTARLQTVWTERGYWPVFKTACARGLWVAGVSAGAVVWFEAALVRNAAKDLQWLPGAGVIPGSICVHFSSEPDRAAPFAEAVKAGRRPAGMAIDDGVAVVIEEGNAPYAFSARPGHGAYWVSGSGLSPLRRVNG